MIGQNGQRNAVLVAICVIASIHLLKCQQNPEIGASDEMLLPQSTCSLTRTAINRHATMLRPINGAVFSPIDGAQSVAPGFIPVRKQTATNSATASDETGSDVR